VNRGRKSLGIRVAELVVLPKQDVLVTANMGVGGKTFGSSNRHGTDWPPVHQDRTQCERARDGLKQQSGGCERKVAKDPCYNGTHQEKDPESKSIISAAYAPDQTRRQESVIETRVMHDRCGRHFIRRRIESERDSIEHERPSPRIHLDNHKTYMGSHHKP
jgi:hypothetical protein